jgi:DNA-binding response OmpR family regulator
MTKQNILIIDDDEKLCVLLKNYLTGFGYAVVSCSHPQAGLKMIHNNQPDLIILDIMLPDMDGFAVCREIRKSFTTPIIMLTARGEVMDRIVGLELGADDYLPKPFEPRELLARIQTILRRANGSYTATSVLRFGALEIFPEKQAATLHSESLDLTTMEFQLLLLLANKRGRIVSRDQIMDDLRGSDWQAYDRSIDVAISRLRQRLQDDPQNPTFIRTIWGSGYMFIGNE